VRVGGAGAWSGDACGVSPWYQPAPDKAWTMRSPVVAGCSLPNGSASAGGGRLTPGRWSPDQHARPDLLGRSGLMQVLTGARPRRIAAHWPAEERTPEGRTRISCASPACAAWDPRPC